MRPLRQVHVIMAHFSQAGISSFCASFFGRMLVMPHNDDNKIVEWIMTYTAETRSFDAFDGGSTE